MSPRSIGSKTQRHARTLLLAAVAAVLALIAVLSVWPRAAGATPCKPDGEACRTNQSCCGGVCVNSAPPGKRPKGTCCTPTTCAGAGANCGLINDGTCPDMLNCGDCTPPDTCGGGGTPNVCGCVGDCSGKECGDDGCGGSCGTCRVGESCQGFTCQSDCPCWGYADVDTDPSRGDPDPCVDMPGDQVRVNRSPAGPPPCTRGGYGFIVLGPDHLTLQNKCQFNDNEFELGGICVLNTEASVGNLTSTEVMACEAIIRNSALFTRCP